MSIFDFLKRRKEIEKTKKQFEKKIVTLVKPKSTKKATSDVAQTEKVQLSKTRKTDGFSYSVIKEPHISEKATHLAEKDKYTFKVYMGSNKPEIKKSVEGIYGVDVLSVKIIKIPHKKRRLGKTQGFRKGFTKAVVTVKEGQKIEVL